MVERPSPPKNTPPNKTKQKKQTNKQNKQTQNNGSDKPIVDEIEERNRFYWLLRCKFEAEERRKERWGLTKYVIEK